MRPLDTSAHLTCQFSGLNSMTFVHWRPNRTFPLCPSGQKCKVGNSAKFRPCSKTSYPYIFPRVPSVSLSVPPPCSLNRWTNRLDFRHGSWSWSKPANFFTCQGQRSKKWKNSLFNRICFVTLIDRLPIFIGNWPNECRSRESGYCHLSVVNYACT